VNSTYLVSGSGRDFVNSGGSGRVGSGSSTGWVGSAKSDTRPTLGATHQMLNEGADLEIPHRAIEIPMYEFL
jgi:hypothetical protein